MIGAPSSGKTEVQPGERYKRVGLGGVAAGGGCCKASCQDASQGAGWPGCQHTGEPPLLGVDILEHTHHVSVIQV